MVYIVCNSLITISVILLILALICTILTLLSIIKRIAILVGTGFVGLEKNWKKEDSMMTK